MIAIHSTKRQRGLIWFGAARAIIGIFLAAALACCTATPATAAEGLYRAQTVVTGQGEANRMIGFASCMEDVLIKVSGAERLAGDRRLAAYKAKARDFVTAFDYRDQFFGKPKRDEQGTRDRPFDLIVDFDNGKIDGVLKALGLKPWLSHRPVLAVFVEMEQGERKFIVTSDGTQSDLQRDALLAATARRGMNIVLPTAAALAKANINGTELSKTPSSTLVSLAAGQGGEVALVGRLVAGGFAASRSMKPFGAASAAPRRCCLTTAKPGAGNDEVRTDLRFRKICIALDVRFWRKENIRTCDLSGVGSA
jgi:hypothetical protein